MVYIDPAELGWRPYMNTWMTEKGTRLKPETKEFLLELFDKYVDEGLKFVNKKCTQAIMQTDLAKVVALCKLLECLVLLPGNVDTRQDPAKLHPLVATTFAFCYLWSIGGNIVDSNWDSFDTFMRGIFDDCPEIKVCAYIVI